MSLFREAVSDLAETLRRVFQNPVSRAVDPHIQEGQAGCVAMLEVQGVEPDFLLRPEARTQPLLDLPALHEESVTFSASLCQEDAWARWASGAQVCEMGVFRAEGCARLEVPALPRKAGVRRGELGPFKVQSRLDRTWIQAPAVRRHLPAIAAPGARPGLDRILGLPVAIAPMDMPKALAMRYTLQLVRSSGENIRNLEILGLYRIPHRGVRGLRHEARTGRVLLDLGPEASGALRAPFILARRRTDLSFVSCFVED